MTNIFWFFVLGLLPSILWLVFYYKKDPRPEPKRMVLIFFLYGIIIALPVALLENALTSILGPLETFPPYKIFLYYFFVVALIEELFKYWVFRFGIMKNPEFDEPTDALVYIIAVALGFAAVENILIIFPTTVQLFLKDAIIIIAYRSVSATILHALASANIGFFFALSLFRTHKRKLYLFLGCVLSVFFHALYNFATVLETKTGILVMFSVIFLLFVIVLWEFAKLNKLKSICKI